MTWRERIGILGGTFDPPHVGHLHLARSAQHDLKLDRVLLMPAGSPPHKPGRPRSYASARWAMVQAAVAGVSGIGASDLDLADEAPSFTADLVAAFANANPNADLWFVMGSDSLHEFPTWHRPDAILAGARLAVVERPGWPIDSALQAPSMHDLSHHVDAFSSVPIALSSSAIRHRLRQGLPVEWLVQPAVLDVIARLGLYRSDLDAAP